MNLDLQNKVVLITGASGGIGLEIAKGFLREGSIVIAAYNSKITEIQDWIEKLSAEEKHRVHPVQINIRKTDKFDEIVQDIVLNYNKIDVLVNGIGNSIEKPLLLMDDEEIDLQLNDNYTAQIKFTKRILKQMIFQKSGNIVNISSLLGSRFGRGVVVYSSAKAALDRFTGSLALEVGKKGIRVNSVCPGFIETKMTTDLQKNMPKELLNLSPIARPGRPEEVANAVLFLASDRCSSYITGTCLRVDGGFGI